MNALNLSEREVWLELGSVCERESVGLSEVFEWLRPVNKFVGTENVGTRSVIRVQKVEIGQMSRASARE